MSRLKEQLGLNLAGLDDRIRAACRKAGRSPNEVTLIAVTKSAPDESVLELPGLDRLDLGENRPQQLIRRAELIPQARWHLIGHLQTNKVRAVLPHCALIHSVDSLKLLELIGKTAGSLQLTVRVLLEVNISGEESKQGFSAAELREQWSEICAVQGVVIEGLMTMAPLEAEEAEVRQVFRGLRELRGELRDLSSDRGSPLALPHLSMGMSGDFEIAVEEGATLIRVGTAIFANTDCNASLG